MAMLSAPRLDGAIVFLVNPETFLVALGAGAAKYRAAFQEPAPGGNALLND
jgi:hypothetical protein